MNEELFIELQKHLKECLSKVIVDGEILDSNKSICFTVSKLGCKILRRLGYNCDIQRVYVIVADEKGAEVYQRQKKSGKFDTKEVTDAGGWTIGLGYPEQGSFHYVIRFDDEKEIMDLTFEQASRPEKGIIAKAYWEYQDNIPKCIQDMFFIKDENIKSIPLYYAPELKQWREQTIIEGYKKLKRWSKK